MTPINAGKMAWFDNLYTANYRSMVRTAERILGSRGLAEDVVQDVFIILINKQAKVKNFENPVAWLYIVLKNLIGNELQKARVRKQTVSLECVLELPADEAPGYSFADFLPESLSAGHSDILTLYYEQGLSIREISQKYDCSELAAKAKLFRARNKCRELLFSDQKKELLINE